MADDLGYSDIHALGGEIDTPNLDSLVESGRILTNHHVGSVSAITRAMLISGTDHHLVGEGTMGAPTDERRGLPGYEGYLNDRALSVAELLRDAGYHTYMAGKWHLGSGVAGSSGQGRTPDQWGFERSFALLAGASGNHFIHEPAGSRNFSSDGVYAQPGQPGQPSGYSSDLYTNQLISYIDANQGDGKPFFIYAAYTAPHWPLAVPDPWLHQYQGAYAAGYDAVRNARLQRMRELGVIPASLTPAPTAPETLTKSPATPNNGTASGKYISAVHAEADGYVDYRAGVINKRWESLSNLEKQAQARYMEIYAGMVTNLDYNIGRLIQHLKQIGQYDNTLIVFHSDNGAEGWPINSGNDPKATDEANAATATVLANLGSDNGQQTAKMIRYGMRWAEVSAAPFAQSKSFHGEGGVVTAAIVRLPKQTSRLPNVDWFSHITDDAATFLEIAGVTPPSQPAPPDIDPSSGMDKNRGKVVYKGRYVYPVTGVSLLSALGADTPAPVTRGAFGDESYGRAYLFSADGHWKARWTEPPFGPLDGHWELFFVADDRCESTDVSTLYPEVASDLLQQWQDYMNRVGGVEPLRPLGPY
jgi:arylsulfatase